MLSCNFTFAQVKPRQLDANRAGTAPKINGVLDDAAWENVPVANNFIQYEPENGSPSKFKTEVKIIYNDIALYIGAMLYDDHPDSIPHELGLRDDNNLNADYFTFYVDPFNDGQHAFAFSVSSSISVH